MALHGSIVSNLFQNTVTVAPHTGQDKYNNPTYGTAVTYTAKIERSVENIRTDTDEEAVSSRKIFLDTTTVPTTRDILTLPTGFEPLTPKILQVRTVTDHVGTSHIVLVT